MSGSYNEDSYNTSRSPFHYRLNPIGTVVVCVCVRIYTCYLLYLRCWKLNALLIHTWTLTITSVTTHYYLRYTIPWEPAVTVEASYPGALSSTLMWASKTTSNMWSVLLGTGFKNR